MGGCCGKNSKEAQIEKDLKSGKKPILWIVGGPGLDTYFKVFTFNSYFFLTLTYLRSRSGKGTQCTRLAQKYKLAHISSGDLLRAEVLNGSELGKKLNEIMETGQLVPREIVLDLLKKGMIEWYEGSNGFLIDGYPREVIQGKEFEEKIGPCTKIVYFEVSDAVMKQRLMQRGKDSGRVDDNEETIANRIKIFHELSEPVIQEYASIVLTISGEQEPDDVFNQCCENLDPLFKT
ncbi:adenylate kinase isoenzyme 1 [Folsomia candida]|uniref:adenylate kinase isoenzyme 1 n=1 Tax=Folsomia candida TaxID=158441 RepID=UPI0016050728|nr:adenylate kinase isoenzyme 1 [Folsomia candida]